MTDGNNMFGSDQDQSVLSYLGEGKKYSTVDELDRAYAHANDHLGKLESENAQLREAMEKLQSQKSTVDQVLEALKPKVQEADLDQADAHQRVKTEDLEGLVKSLLDKSKQESQREENNRKVREALKEKYGDRAEEVYKEKGNSLGIDLDSLSESSPAAVLELFKTQQSSNPGQNSTFNSESLDSSNIKYGTHKYWEDQYKNKLISREEKFRQQHKSLDKMGEDYWK